MKGLGITLGVLGLTLFVAGVAWVLLAQAPASCEGRIDCERDSFARLLSLVQFIWLLATGVMVAGAALVALQLRDARARTRQPPKPAPRARVPVDIRPPLDPPAPRQQGVNKPRP